MCVYVENKGKISAELRLVFIIESWGEGRVLEGT